MGKKKGKGKQGGDGGGEGASTSQQLKQQAPKQEQKPPDAKQEPPAAKQEPPAAKQQQQPLASKEQQKKSKSQQQPSSQTEPQAWRSEQRQPPTPQQQPAHPQQRGPAQQQQAAQQQAGPPQQQAPPQQQGPWGPPAQQAPPPQWGPAQRQAVSQQQRGPPQQQDPQQHRGPQQQTPQQQRGPQQQAPQQQRGPQQQAPQQQRGPQQQGPQQQRGPQQQAPQQQQGPQQQAPQQQRGPQQQAPQQQRGPQQQGPQQQRGPQQQQGPQQQAPQQQRGPQQQAPQQQRGPQQQAPQQQWGPQQQRGGPPQQQRGPPQYQQVPGFPPGMMPPQQGPPPGMYAPPPAGTPAHLSGPPPQQVAPVSQQAPPQQARAGGGGGDTPRQQPGGKGKARGSAAPEHKPSASGDQPSPQRRQQGPAPPAAQMSKLQLSPSEVLPLIKAKPGVKGRKIPIETNHLQLMLGNLNSAIHYDVNLVPDTPKKFLRMVMDKFRLQYYPKRYPAFDGRKNLYSTSQLFSGDYQEGEVVIHDSEGREKKYKVEVKFANEVDLRPLKNYELSRETPREALQVVDIVLRCAPAQSLITVGRSFFHKPEQILDLGEGMEMYHGFYQSAVRGWKPFLNVDVAHKAFPKGMSVVDALVELLDTGYNRFSRESLSRPLDRRDVETFSKFIKTLRVVYEIPGISASRRIFRVNGLNEPAATKRFTLDNGQQTTVQEYFANQKRFRLKYPSLPTLWVGSIARADNPILIPPELCTLEEGQVLNRKMTENQTAKMIKYSATNTAIRKTKIVNGMREANHNQHPTVREFGFSVANSFEQLEARVLTPPVLGYNNSRKVNPAKGIWRGDKFLAGATINNWTIVCADRRPPRADDFNNLATAIFNEAGHSGLQMTQQAERPFQTIGATQQDIRKYFQGQKGKYEVIFVIVPNSGPQYSFVKTAAEINVGCLTQCIKIRTVGRMNPQTALNILLKVNAKLNGTNHCLETRPPILNRPTMIMGADVTHPSPDSQNIPSVAAVTASHDPKAFKYNICWRLQPPRMEIIEDLENIMLEQLNYFFKMNKGQKPQRIVFFRDGVSEGQFEEVRIAEIRAIRSACKKMQPEGYEPAITFLVVQKRHHTRLFPLNPRDSEDRNSNVPAGTCVDTTITHPFMQDFYLVSHASIQGVAKPTKYCTLWDDNNLSNDEIEELAYFLCHMFTRCNRSVSYPAPTYYAHLAAARAKVYIENERLDLNNLNREYDRFLIQDNIRKGLPMFFV